MKNTWNVIVNVDNERILSISDGHMAGIGDVSDYEDEIRECAKHLLGFIGELGQLEAAEQAGEEDACDLADDHSEFLRGGYVFCPDCGVNLRRLP